MIKSLKYQLYINKGYFYGTNALNQLMQTSFFGTYINYINCLRTMVQSEFVNLT